MFETNTGQTLLGDPLMTLASRPHNFKTKFTSKEVTVEVDGCHEYLTCRRCARRACMLCEDIWDEECLG